MTYDPEKHHRRTIRLPEYDYRQSGAYFITICTQNKKKLFGEITDDAMDLNNTGGIVQEIWDLIPNRFPHVLLDAFVIMPNHIHGILIVGAGSSRPDSSSRGPLPSITECIKSDQDRPENNFETIGRDDPAPTLGQMVGWFKYLSTKKFNEIQNTGIQKLWQRNYYEHIVRDDADFIRIRQYIQDNPLNWQTDTLYLPLS